ncbi:MAG: hypothetical protein AAF335_00355 [Bacteroidota bacterium]
MHIQWIIITFVSLLFSQTPIYGTNSISYRERRHKAAKEAWKRIRTIRFCTVKACKEHCTKGKTGKDDTKCSKKELKRLKYILKNDDCIPLAEVGDACIEYQYYYSRVENGVILLPTYNVLKYLLHDNGEREAEESDTEKEKETEGYQDKKKGKTKKKGFKDYQEFKKCLCDEKVADDLLLALDRRLIYEVSDGPISTSKMFNKEKIKALMPGYAEYYRYNPPPPKPDNKFQKFIKSDPIQQLIKRLKTCIPSFSSDEDEKEEEQEKDKESSNPFKPLEKENKKEDTKSVKPITNNKSIEEQPIQDPILYFSDSKEKTPDTETPTVMKPTYLVGLLPLCALPLWLFYKANKQPKEQNTSPTKDSATHTSKES